MGTGEHLWRFAVGFGALIALVLYILRINYLKESPTWMINHHSLKKLPSMYEIIMMWI